MSDKDDKSEIKQPRGVNPVADVEAQEPDTSRRTRAAARNVAQKGDDDDRDDDDRDDDDRDDDDRDDDDRDSDKKARSAQQPRKNAAPGKASSKAKPRKPNWFTRLTRGDFNALLENSFGLDLRSLGIFRIAMGILVLSDVWHRSLHLVAHYTDDGFMPRDKLLGGWSNALFYSFHNWGGNVTSQVILFAITAGFAVMLTIGLKTRLASILCFLMVASVQGRNYLILQGGDDLLRVMLFWSMFVPLGARYSVDAVFAEPRAGGVPKRIFSVGSMALALQLLVMYSVSALLKTGPTWQAQGSAIHLALHHHAFATPFGMWFRELPAPILQYMTWGVFYLELIGPLLFFFPVRNDWARTLQVFAFIGFHFGLYLTMELGHFVWVAMAAWLVMFPSWFWDKPFHSLLLKLNLKDKLCKLSDGTRAFILKRRHWFRVRESRPLRIKPTLFGTLLASVLALYTAYGTAYAAAHRGDEQDDHLNPMLMLRLYANWGMFAPNPPNTSGWFVMVGKRKDGVEVDVWNDNVPVTWEKPEVPSATYRTQRWRKFLDNIVNPRHAVVRPYFLKWLCKDWNESHDEEEQVRSITMYHMKQTVKFPEKAYTALEKEKLQRQTCPAVPKKRD